MQQVNIQRRKIAANSGRRGCCGTLGVTRRVTARTRLRASTDDECSGSEPSEDWFFVVHLDDRRERMAPELELEM